MVYRLHFFAKAGEENGQAAINRLLEQVVASGQPVLSEWRGPFVDEVAAYRLATSGPDGAATADWLTLELHLGAEFNANMVIGIDPDDGHEIWGCDVHAQISLSGQNPDWELVHRIWSALERLWCAVAWDEQSGFAISRHEPS